MWEIGGERGDHGSARVRGPRIHDRIDRWEKVWSGSLSLRRFSSNRIAGIVNDPVIPARICVDLPAEKKGLSENGHRTYLLDRENLRLNCDASMYWYIEVEK
jgi:hypothetical protein